MVHFRCRDCSHSLRAKPERSSLLSSGLDLLITLVFAGALVVPAVVLVSCFSKANNSSQESDDRACHEGCECAGGMGEAGIMAEALRRVIVGEEGGG